MATKQLTDKRKRITNLGSNSAGSGWRGWWLDEARACEKDKAKAIRKIADAVISEELGPGFGCVWARFLYNLADELE